MYWSRYSRGRSEHKYFPWAKTLIWLCTLKKKSPERLNRCRRPFGLDSHIAFIKVGREKPLSFGRAEKQNAWYFFFNQKTTYSLFWNPN